MPLSGDHAQVSLWQPRQRARCGLASQKAAQPPCRFQGTMVCPLCGCDCSAPVLARPARRARVSAWKSVKPPGVLRHGRPSRLAAFRAPRRALSLAATASHPHSSGCPEGCAGVLAMAVTPGSPAAAHPPPDHVATQGCVCVPAGQGHTPKRAPVPPAIMQNTVFLGFYKASRPWCPLTTYHCTRLYSRMQW